MPQGTWSDNVNSDLKYLREQVGIINTILRKAGFGDLLDEEMTNLRKEIDAQFNKCKSCGK